MALFTRGEEMYFKVHRRKRDEIPEVRGLLASTSARMTRKKAQSISMVSKGKDKAWIMSALNELGDTVCVPLK
ncbi:hypothetical protein F443_16243 [Phytophthora nicotianae P1569]|uniref:Uncharacterized protein n=1 Tax=Phytophthora nicotianae P1569 TaxID=1317065 RepID=V9EFC8_PHYNI|nr:hypothetical protein F443_16243 [Phytophthora nicotianae P1569]